MSASFRELFEQAAAASRADGGISRNTRKTYWSLLKEFSAFTAKRATEWRGADLPAWMHHLDRERYSISSRRQKLCAVIWAFKRVLKIDPGKLDLPTLPRQQKHIRIIPSSEELARIFAGLKDPARLMCGIMYGAGLRISECCELRMKDIDFGALTIRVHDGKGGKDRLALLPVRLVDALQRWMQWRASLHANDLAHGDGYAELPGRLAIKYKSAARDLRWQYLFPSAVVRDRYRWFITPEAVQKAVRIAVKGAGITKLVTPHTLRAAFATHALRCGNDMATVQGLMGHDSPETTLIYVGADGADGVSPLDVQLPTRPQAAALPARQFFLK